MYIHYFVLQEALVLCQDQVQSQDSSVRLAWYYLCRGPTLRRAFVLLLICAKFKGVIRQKKQKTRMSVVGIWLLLFP